MTTALREQADGEIVCAHRSTSCCPDCFRATPNLVDVYGAVYRWHGEGWPGQVAAIGRGDVEGVTVSPGTLPALRIVR